MPAMLEPIQPRTSAGTNNGRNFTEIVQFFRRNFLFIIGSAFGVGLLVAVYLLLTVGKSYEAVATLVIVPPRFASELKPQTLTVQSYQTILESDAVVAETKKRLAEKGVLATGSPLRLGQELETRIFVSRRAEETTLAPMLQAVARGKTGDQAAAIANTWADVFFERTRDLIAGTTSSTVKFIDQQYPQVRDTLTKLEEARVAEADALQKKANDVATLWDGRVTTFKGETASLLGDYQARTRTLTEEFNAQHNTDSRKGQLAALRKAYGTLQEEQAGVTSQLQLKQLQLDAARKQLAATPPLVTLQKAITDDALWRAMGDSKSGDPDWKVLQQRSLATQEVNPVYTSLSNKVAEIEMDVNAMVPRSVALSKDLERIDGEMNALDGRVRGDDAELDKLARDREAGLTRLNEERTNQLTLLHRNRDEALDAVNRETGTRLGQMDREIAQQRDLFDQLARSYNQALLAKGEQGVEDVRLGAPAVAPDRPQPRGRAMKALAAAVLGGMLGWGVALIRETLRKAEA